MNRLKKARFLLAYPLVVWLFLVASTTEERLRAGIGIITLGLMLRFWANGYVGHVKVNWTQKWRNDPKIGQFITAGPYAFVRHPLYFGSFLLGLGILVIVGRWWVGVTALSVLFLVYLRKMAEEERTLREEWQQEFERYRHAVPQYLPTWRRYPHRQGRWSWQGIRASKEWKTIIWVLVIVLALYLREEALQEHDLLSSKEGTKHALALGMAFALMLTDGVVELIRRWRRRAQTAPA